MLHWTVAHWAIALLVATAHALTDFTVTYTDTSPALTYSPSSSGLAENAWNQTYYNVSWAFWSPTVFPDTWSSHVTTHVGASVSVDFVGTAVAFYGSASGEVTLNVDGEDAKASVSATNDTIAGKTVNFGSHTATLTLAAGSIELQRVLVTAPVGGEGSQISLTNITALGQDTNQNPLITVTSKPNWRESTSYCGDPPNEPQNSNSQSYSCITGVSILGTSTPDEQLSFSSPPGATLLRIFGDVGAEYGPFRISITPLPPYMNRAYDGSAKQDWRAYHRNLFSCVLDPAVQYAVSMANKGNGSEVMEFTRASFVVPSGGALWSPVKAASNGTGSDSSESTSNRSTSVPIGAVVGGVVGGVVLLAIAGLLFWCLRRRKPTGSIEKVSTARRGRRWHKRNSALSDFEVDTLDQTHQPAGDYHAMPSTSNVDLAPEAAHVVTPLPVPWPSDVSHGSYTQASSPTSPSAPFGKPVYGTASLSHQASTGHSTYTSYPPSRAPSTPSLASRPKAGRPAPAVPVPPVTEAQDAGRLPVPEEVPPRYNPAWAEEHPSATVR